MTGLLSTRFGAWLQLARPANLPTAWSNVLMGTWLANQNWLPIDAIVLLVVGSSCFYIAGMILNDVVDVQRDSQERPDRPIPSGRVSRTAALVVAISLLVAGLTFAVVAGGIKHGWWSSEFWRTAAVAALLLICIVGYDWILKLTVMSPIVMGACRFFNVLLGCSMSDQWSTGIAGFDLNLVLVAGIVGLYICGITWFARDEAQETTKLNHFIGAGLILVALGTLHVLPYRFGIANPSRIAGCHIFLILATLFIFWRIQRAIQFGKPMFFQQAIVMCLFSLIILDAFFVMLRSPDQPLAALFIAALLVPSNIIGRTLRPT